MGFPRLAFSRLFTLIAFSLLLADASAQSRNKSPLFNQKYVPGHILVKFRPGVSRETIQASHKVIGSNVLRVFSSVEGLQLVQYPAGTNLSQALAGYRNNPNVVYAEPDYVVHALKSPNDPLFTEMWALQNAGQNGGTVGADIHATQAWDITTGSANVVIAVIDTGVDYNHPDLAANIFSGPVCPNNIVCHGMKIISGSVGDPNDPLDDNGHGTHVSGTIGAVGNNNLGVVGVNWNVKILPCKFLDLDGFGGTSDAIGCLDFVKKAKDSGINIVASNNSWGGGDFSQALQDAIDRQRQSGILFIAAAGNDFSDNDVAPVYPASYPLANIIAVAATDRRDHRAFFSNVGRHTVSLGAPGQEILSTFLGGGYETLSGTSMATPHVTGVAALLAAQDPTRDWRAIKNLILAGGDSLPGLASTITGKRLDAEGSLTCTNSTVATRLDPVSDISSGTAGVSILLAAMNIKCAQPNGPVTVSVSPGGQVITLTDNGVAPDAVAGDGIYTGQFVPPAIGVYTLSFSTGDTATVQVLTNYQPIPTAFNYRTITGTNLDLGDDDVARINSPFPIPFGGGSFSQLWVSANGTISFDGAFSSPLNVPMPTGISSLPNPPLVNAGTLVAPFWDDLFPLKGTAQNVFWDVTGTAPNRELVVEWRDVRAFECAAEQDTIKFQTVFFENSSDVLFNYFDVVFGGNCLGHDRGGRATEGVQISQDTGVMWGFGGRDVSIHSEDIDNGMAIVWHASSASNPPPVPIVNSISPTIVNAFGPDFVLTVNGANFVPQSRVVTFGDRPTTFQSSTQLTAFIPASDLNPFQYLNGSMQVVVINPNPPGLPLESQPVTLNVSVPKPTITSLSPPSTPANGFGFFLRVQGTGFFPFANVVFNGQRLDITSFALGATEVDAVIPGDLLLTPGTVNVQIINPAGPPSDPITFTITAPGAAAISGKMSQPYLVAHNPFSGKLSTRLQGLPNPFLGWNHARQQGMDYLGRFIRPYGKLFTSLGDEKPEPLPEAQSKSAALALTLPGLDLRDSLLAGFLPTNVAVGDFNHDGHLDWVVSNGGSNDLWVYLGNGDGTAQPPRIIPLSGSTPIAVAAADLRGIGVLDLIVAEADSLTVGVLLGNGDGTFGPENLYFAPAPPISLAVADFNGDSHPDVVVGLIGTEITGAVAFLPGDGTGKLGAPVFSPIARNVEPTTGVLNLTVGDVNNDGIPDLLVTDVNIAETGVFVYIGTGDGRFKKGQNLGGVLNGALGDLNGDGCLDAVSTDVFGLANVYLGHCDGTFTPLEPNSVFSAGEAAYGAALADVNGDGKLDLITSGVALIGATGGPFGGQYGGMLSVQFGDGTGAFGHAHVYRGRSGMFGLAVADLNGDGHPDVVAPSQDTDSVSIFMNDGAGGFGGPQGAYVGWFDKENKNGPNGVVNGATAMFPADLNGDGKQDLLFTDFGQLFDLPWNLGTSLNDGAGNFLPDFKSSVMDGRFDFFGNLVLGDFRKTGLPDAVLTPNQLSSSFSAPFFAFVPNTGGGHFGAPVVTNLGMLPGAIAAGDFNGDGKLDFVMAGPSPTPPSLQLATFLGNGDGTFSAGPTQFFNANSEAFRIFEGDFNGDGKPDLLVMSLFSGPQIFEFLGNGDGSFRAPVTLTSSFGPITLVDVNHDGRTDIVSIDVDTDSRPLFNIYLAQPDGSFVLTHTYKPYSGSGNGGLVADFNGDGNADIAWIGTDSGQIYVQFLLGNGDGTFTPTYNKFLLRAGVGTSLPSLAADMNGDGRDDLVELDGFVASFHVIHSIPGTSLRIQFVSLPVLGSKGLLRVSLAVPAAQDTAVELAASDPNIKLPASVTINVGTLSQDVILQVDSAFDHSRGFTVTAQTGLEQATAQGFVAVPGANVGIGLSTFGQKQVILAGENTQDYRLSAFSIAGYETTVNLSCTGLPVGASCQLGSTTLNILPGAFASTSLVVTTSAGIPIGNYPFTVQATDGVTNNSLPLMLGIGDFTVSASDPPVGLPTDVISGLVTVGSVNGFVNTIFLSCSGLPSGATCSSLPFVIPPGQSNISVQTNNVPVGNYPFMITGGDGTVSHNASAVLHVGNFGSATISPTSATLSVGQSANFNLTVGSTNGFAGTIVFGCNANKTGIGCTFTPPRASFDTNGKLATQLKLTVVSQPTGSSQTLPKAALRPSVLWTASVAVAIFLVPATISSRRKKLNMRSLLVFSGILVLCLLVSCGGGGSGSVTQSPPPPPPPPPPGPQTIVVTVVGNSPNGVFSNNLGTITITVQ